MEAELSMFISWISHNKILVKYTNDAKGRLFNDNLPFELE